MILIILTLVDFRQYCTLSYKQSYPDRYNTLVLKIFNAKSGIELLLEVVGFSPIKPY